MCQPVALTLEIVDTIASHPHRALLGLSNPLEPADMKDFAPYARRWIACLMRNDLCNAAVSSDKLEIHEKKPVMWNDHRVITPSLHEHKVITPELESSYGSRGLLPIGKNQRSPWVHLSPKCCRTAMISNDLFSNVQSWGHRCMAIAGPYTCQMTYMKCSDFWEMPSLFHMLQLEFW